MPDRKGGMLRCLVSESEDYEYVTVHGVGAWPTLSMLERVAYAFWPDAPVYVGIKDNRLRFKVVLFTSKNEQPLRTTSGA